MSARQDVFNYLESHPNAPLKEVLSNFPDAKESTIRRYYFESQKSGGKKETSQKKKVNPKNEKSAPKKTKTAPKAKE